MPNPEPLKKPLGFTLFEVKAKKPEHSDEAKLVEAYVNAHVNVPKILKQYVESIAGIGPGELVPYSVPFVPPKTESPQIHCPLCGSQLYLSPDQVCVRCKCGEVKISCVDIAQKDFHTLLKNVLAVIAHKAVDMAAMKAQEPDGIAPKMFDFELPNVYAGIQTISGPSSWKSKPPKSLAAKMLGYDFNIYGVKKSNSPYAGPMKVGKDSVKLEALSPALQEFFKDYVESKG